MRRPADASPVPHLRFPPGLQHVLIPQAPASAAALGMTLYTASRPVTLLLQRGLWLVARVGGARLLPGRREHWRPPIVESTFAELTAQWNAAAGFSAGALAIYERPQAFRPGLVCLLCDGRRSLLVRVRKDPAELEVEKRISSAASKRADMAFRVPELAGSGEADGWHWAGYRVMAQRPHAPARDCGDEVVRCIVDLVGGVVPRPEDVPEHWEPAHGDLTPWNLRSVSGRRWLIDWEDARWAPPGTDLVYFLATSAAIGVRRSAARLAALSGYREARDRWTRELRGRRLTDRETALTERILEALSRAPD